jgi:hypothetical protein
MYDKVLEINDNSFLNSPGLIFRVAINYKK